MPKRSAGIIVYRVAHQATHPAAHEAAHPATHEAAHRSRADGMEVLLVHPGGPFWARKDDGAWSIPKGEYGEADDPWQAALREFREELGLKPPAGRPVPLGEVRQKGGKTVLAWAVEGDLDVTAIRSNTVSLEWPRGSGRVMEFPEVDRAAWFDVAAARRKVLSSQQTFLDRLVEEVGGETAPRGRNLQDYGSDRYDIVVPAGLDGRRAANPG